ncbi:MAG: hypothetical protein QOH29_2621 [Actinomycetota bacterium]|nr:hypothetical protein [Actinomycetota bacterium]
MPHRSCGFDAAPCRAVPEYSGGVAGASYRVYAFYRIQVIAMFVVFAVVAVVLVVNLATGASGPPIGFSVFWIAAVVWNAYWFLLRVAYRVDLQDHELRWRAPLKSGTIPLDTLREIRPSRMSSNVELFEWDGGRPLIVFAMKGLRDFCAVIQAATPHVGVRFGWQARLAERMPGPRRFRRL